MDRKWIVLGAALVVLVAAAAGPWVAELFLPERATDVDEPASTDGTVLKSGTFAGKAGHRVSGTVSVIEDGDGYALRFENYSQTQGPDVYVYLTPASDPDTTAEIREGLKVLVDGGADGGESTKEGTFTQRLPDGVDPAAYDGVAIWCDRFSVPFGSAPLSRTTPA